jgi:hypothetical protein
VRLALHDSQHQMTRRLHATHTLHTVTHCALAAR